MEQVSGIIDLYWFSYLLNLGKSSTFSMLVADESITYGQAFIEGYDISADLSEAQQHFGYCPQGDALSDLLTPRETLKLYAHLRGIKQPFDQTIVNALIYNLNLDRWADKPTKTLSGGNKRKLSIAVALVGNPAIVFLDEPTAGVDPAARRFLWTQIDRIVSQGKSVVLTSHSMDECEALCNRIGIMVNGQFQAFGSPQHLKSKFGDGYTLSFKARQTLPVKAFVHSKITNAVLQEEHKGYLRFLLPTSSVVSFPALFMELERAKQAIGFDDFELTQTTLESVFIKFAKLQSDWTEPPVTTSTPQQRPLSRKAWRSPTSSPMPSVSDVDEPDLELEDYASPSASPAKYARQTSY